jgi:diguanylate cyclase (GGDEF)-like protein/PAS domain S-box-containing protein
LSDFLVENGYLTETVTTGEDAVEKACTNPAFDLILMDIELEGEMNGIEAARLILKCIDIPIIFLSSNSSKNIFNTLKRVPAYGFVLKGIDKYALLSTIEMALSLFALSTKTKMIYGEYRKAYEELETSRKQFLELTENAPVGIVKCDQNGTIVFINQKALEILGSPSVEETKRINLLTYPPLVQHGFSKLLEKCIQGNEQGVSELNYVSKWGKQVCIRLHIKPIIERNQSRAAQVIIDDVSEKKHLEEELRKLSLTDPLTNIYNRRYFIQKLEEEMARVQRQSSTSFCIAMLDVDHFKSINDRFGHYSGDLVLKKLTSIIKRRIRKMDCLARWGGEEFILLFPDTSASEAQLLMEELRKSISKMKSPIDEEITASFGLVEYFAGDTVDSMIQRADNRMYEAKKAGRNCVRF